MSQTNGTIRINAYSIDLNQVLGKGATGYVYRGFHSETHEPVAVKAIQMSQVSNQVTQYLLEGQKKAMMTIKNPYIIKTHDIVQEKDYCYIIMEQCCNGTLKDYIQQKGKLCPSQAIDLFRKIVIGYISIVDSMFIHRDLKTANILLRTNGDPVIIDFGYCQMIMAKRPMIQYNVGSPSYMSPQAYSKSRYSQKSDIWSLGVILYEMLTGKTIDNGMNIKQFFKIIESEGRVRINSQGMTLVSVELLNMSLQVDPEKRATIHRLKYIIDKSLIPQMHTNLRKASSDTVSSKISSNQLRFVSPAHFNYATVKKDSGIQKKQKIAENLKFLRNSVQVIKIGQSSQIVFPANSNRFNNSMSTQQRNHQSSMSINSIDSSLPQQHKILRRSLQRSLTQTPPLPPQAIIKKIMSIKQVQLKPSFKKIPVLHKIVSIQPTIITNSSRDNFTSMRMI